MFYIASEVIINGPRESLMLVLNGHIGRTILCLCTSGLGRPNMMT